MSWIKNNKKNIMEEYEKNKVIDECIRMWREKDMPEGITSYEELRNFRQFWFERSSLDKNEAYSLYTLNK